MCICLGPNYRIPPHQDPLILATQFRQGAFVASAQLAKSLACLCLGWYDVLQCRIADDCWDTESEYQSRVRNVNNVYAWPLIKTQIFQS